METPPLIDRFHVEVRNGAEHIQTAKNSPGTQKNTQIIRRGCCMDLVYRFR